MPALNGMLDYSIRPRLHRKITSPSFLGKNLFSRSAAASERLESKILFDNESQGCCACGVKLSS
jgi:hypothetical protein